MKIMFAATWLALVLCVASPAQELPPRYLPPTKIEQTKNGWELRFQIGNSDLAALAWFGPQPKSVWMHADGGTKQPPFPRGHAECCYASNVINLYNRQIEVVAEFAPEPGFDLAKLTLKVTPTKLAPAAKSNWLFVEEAYRTPGVRGYRDIGPNRGDLVEFGLDAAIAGTKAAQDAVDTILKLAQKYGRKADSVVFVTAD